MRIRVFIKCVLLIAVVACADKHSDVQYHYLNNDWMFKEMNDSIWAPAIVPGTVQADLLSLGKIPDPFIQSNEDSIQWISEKNWQYKKTFSVSKKNLQKQKHHIKFDGLDTYASVYFNDSLILQANNAFRSWEIDVSDALKLENNLLIQFHSTDSIEAIQAAKLEYTLPEAPRIFTRKPQFQYGWDWAPTIKTMGVWRDISLVSYDIAKCSDIFLQTKSISDTLAELTVKLTIETSDYNQIVVELLNKNTNELWESSIELQHTIKEYEIPFTIKNPKLWWTHNLGVPFLYDIQINLKKGRKNLQTYSKKLGVRTIELNTEKDSIGNRFYFKLNNKPIYIKGANYIPQQIIHPKVNQNNYLKLINDVVAANMNMLRVWGGGSYEDNFFYQLCDAKGILVWQDFMFACGMYPGDTQFLENVKQEAIEHVKRLRGHPSIALWCGNNENSEGWFRWGWQEGKSESQKQDIWNDYTSLFNGILPQIIDSLAPGLDYWESSPKYGRGDKRFQFEGDAHDWWVWHDGYPFEHFEKTVPRFMSEFGFQSFPSYEAIRLFTEQDTINLSHPAFNTHQKHTRGYQLIRDYMTRDFPVPENDADYVYVSQLLQAYGICKGIHAHRRAKPYNMGTLYWQLNDCWPAVSWSSIDALGNWKALHHKAKHAFENILISTEEKNDSLEIYIINDTFSDIKNTMSLLLMDFEGNEITSHHQEVVSLSDTSNVIIVFPMNQIPFDPASSVLKITFGDSKYLHYFTKPKELKLLPEDIKSVVSVIKGGFSITLSSNTLQKDVFLISDHEGRFEDNFFDLLPNETKTIIFKTEVLNSPIITIKTLNQL